ncbi:MAG: hypothetical protein ACK500_03190 [Flavobacteriales bacterium]
MSEFKVRNIQTYNTIKIDGGWSWAIKDPPPSGELVMINNFSLDENDPAMSQFREVYQELIKIRLKSLIENKFVELRNPIRIIESQGQNILLCDVSIAGTDIAQYFNDFKGLTKESNTHA